MAIESGPTWRSVQAKSGQDSAWDRGINGITGFVILCVAGKWGDSATMARERAAAVSLL